MTLSGKRILLGITGGIAAYKTCELIRQFIKAGAQVKAVVTPSAKEFITDTTLTTLTKNKVYCGQFEVDNWQPEHISLADNADLFIIAPASANTIGKIANGICDNLLISLVTAFNKPVILAPAMNCNMWNNTFVQKNLTLLKQSGFHIIPPESGDLACGYSGEGRLADIGKILNKSIEILENKKFLENKKLVITAGGTKEPIDPVRYIGNHSSGKMGIALADAAYLYGADVTLISTVKVDKGYNVINVQSAQEMLEATKLVFTDSEVLIMTAAVADYRIKNISEHKIKKESSDSITIELVKNPDILKTLSESKKHSQVIIGFAAESENLIDNAKQKIRSKNLDYIVANDISNLETGFNSDYNSVSLIDQQENILEIPKSTKEDIAKELLKAIFLKS